VACGSLNRSLPNLEAGARTPMAAVFSALVVLVLATAGAGLLARVPLAAISALLLPVAWSLLDLPSWRRLWRLSRSDFAVAGATLLATVALRMELAILLGTIASLGLYLHRTAHPAMRRMGFDSMREDRRFVVVDGNPDALPPCRELLLLRMEGSVYFGAVAHVADKLQALRDEPDAPPHLLVMTKSMNEIDLAGCELWLGELRARRAMGGDLYFHRPRPQVMEMWEKSGFLAELGADHVFPDKQTAIASILARLGDDPCARCGRRVFHECRRAKPADAKPARN
jgi:SulP family sulfate permease